MTYAAEHNTIENVLKTQFSTPNSIDTIFDNVDYNGKKNEWVRATIFPAKAEQVSLGPQAYHRYTGTLICQIFVRPDIGTGRALAIADLLSPLFRAKRISDITFRTPAVRVVGRDEKAQWFQVNLSVNFFREEFDP